MQSHSHVAVIMLGFMIIFVGFFGILLSNFNITVNAKTNHDIKYYVKHQTNPKEHFPSTIKFVANGGNTEPNSNVGHSTLNPGQWTTNITIVDERQKVLYYWMEAARTGTITDSGVTLIRFDKHSSLAVPSLVSKYPLFQIPTIDTIVYLLQSNQQYVMASVLSGLIKEIIWIWPKWDHRSHFEEYSLSLIEAGVTTVGDKEKLEFCMCVFDSESSENACFHNSLSERESGVVNINYVDCDVQYTVKYVEIREDLAAEYLKRKADGGISERSDVILDIDVDFLNFTDASEFLVQANITRYDVEDLDSNLSRLFCPKNGSEETIIDKCIIRFINDVASLKNERHPASKYNSTKLYTYGKQYFQTHTIEWLPYICSVTEVQKTLFLSRFLRSIVTFTIPQLEAIKKTGFCINTVEQSVRKLPIKEFVVCTGEDYRFNKQSYHVDPGELKERMTNFLDTLTHVTKLPVKLVTVCRSVRDGFTSRATEPQFERLILKGLQSKLADTKLLYDQNVLERYTKFRDVEKN